MKWIKYQVVQCTVGQENVLATKKVGYSDANLAIAQGEAYNGQYEIIEDAKPAPFQGIVPTNLSDSVTSDSDATKGIAATPKAVKAAYDLAKGKADSKHGNHVPNVESANNARFLRNDNTWQDVTPTGLGMKSEPLTFKYEDNSTRTVEVYTK